MAAAISLLFVGGMLGLLLSGVVPGYQTAAGEELGERTLATAGGTIESVATDVDGDLERTETVSLPATIQNANYRLVLRDETLSLEHPRGSIERSHHLSLPESITTVDSHWDSGGDLLIHVSGPSDDRTIIIGSTPNGGNN